MSLVLQLLGPLLTRISFLGCLAQITHDRFLFVFFFLADFICEPGIKRSLLKCQYLILVISDFVEEAGSAVCHALGLLGGEDPVFAMESLV